MRFTWPTKRQQTDGFTLIEMLIIAPIVILAISGFVALMVSMVGDVLLTRDQNAMAYNVQSALDQIEQDVRLGTEFLTTTDDLETPQGSNNNFTGNAPFTNGNGTFIISAVTTNKNPTDTSRWLVYYANQPNACNSGEETFNRVFLMKIVYFIKDGDLWRRTILPDYNTNATPDAQTICDNAGLGIWQQNSCSPGYATPSRCETNDTMLLANVTAFDIEYFAEPGDTIPLADSDAEAATTVKVTLSTGQKTAGKDISFTGSVRATRLNNIDNSIPPPPTPTPSYTLSGPASATFSWDNIPIANSYEISYNINGGAATEVSLDAGTHEYTIDATRNDTITFSIAAKNVAGTSDYATITATTPAWTNLDLQNGWVNYGNGYDTSAFTRTSAGVVVLKGLIKDGSTPAGTVIATLPAGYRPSNRLIFHVSTHTVGNPYDTGMGRVDVMPNGDVVTYIADSGWLSLSDIRFIPSGSGHTWISPMLQNGWTNYGGSWQDLRITKDSLGRAHLEGLVVPGTTSMGTAIATLSASYSPSRSILIPGKDTGSNFAYFGIYSDGRLAARSTGTAYISTQSMYYPSSAGSWSNLALQNGWVEHSTTYSSAQYTKASDGIVTVKGLIKSGSTTGGTVIATLPPGYRPSDTLIFAIAVNTPRYGRVDIRSNGDIVVRYVDTDWTSLDNISFVADQ